MTSRYINQQMRENLLLLIPCKKYVASVGGPVEHSPTEVKEKKRKVSSLPSQPEQASVSKPSMRGRQYSTRSSLRLVSRFSNTTADPVDLVSSSHISGDGSGHDNVVSSGSVSTEGDDGKTPPDSPVVYEEMYSDDQPVQQHGFFLPSCEAATARRASIEFSSEYPLLDSIATIFSESDAAQAKRTLLMAKLEDFHNKRCRLKLCSKRTSEALDKKLLSNKCETKAFVDELVSLKEDYGTWTREMKDSEYHKRSVY
ncbi:hypothetical protein F511_24956 [Dorcoceras hygrometricum]|uniref:Uncharacterized protein n=1 Tax=Dorcoceras hygrometricum TaxID=472368 RepID=A0A2Z7DCT8_9LAMI|nr:hypothetical protein F511_24956 [Dorcoceras hygrometricum]